MKKLAFLIIAMAIVFSSTVHAQTTSPAITVQALHASQPPTLAQTADAYKAFFIKKKAPDYVVVTDDKLIVYVSYKKYGTTIGMPKALYDSYKKYVAYYVKENAGPPIPLM